MVNTRRLWPLLLASAPLFHRPLAAQTRFAGNTAIDFAVPAVRLADRYGPITAGDGRFLIAATEWRNRIPITVIDGKAMPTPYLVPDLLQQVFLVADGVVASMAPATLGRPGVLPAKMFTVPDPDTPTRGNLVFAVPKEVQSAVLLFTDENHGAFTLPLLATGDPPKPIAGPVRNELVEANVLAIRSVEPAAGDAATALETIAIDLRIVAVQKRQQQAKCAALVDWPAFGDSLQLLVDGEGLAPVETPLPKTSRFLPELGTGGELRFRVPRQRQSLHLLLVCPELPTKTGRQRPAPLLLPLVGTAPPPPAAPGLLTFGDVFYQLSLLSLTTQQTPAGERLVGTFRVTATGSAYEVFQPRAQLLLVDAKGQQLPAEASPAIALMAPERLLLPPAATRQFALAWPVTAGPLRLGYQSADPQGSRVLALPDVAASATAPTAPAAPAPAAPTPAASAPAATTPAGDTPAAAPTAKAPSPRAPAATANKGAPPPPRVPIRSDRAPKSLAGVGLSAEQVNASIDRGTLALWDLLSAGKRQPTVFNSGQSVLAALALVHSGFHKRDPAFDRSVRTFLGRREPWNDTYIAGLIGMLIEAYGDPEFLPLLRANTEWLVNSQLGDGSWGYGQPDGKNLAPFFTTLAPPPPALLRCEAPPDLATLRSSPVVRNPAMPKHPGGGDNSVTQYALLGLDAAARVGLAIPDQVWRDALQLTRERQLQTGAWEYNGAKYGGSGAMTAAGLCALAFGNYYLGQPIDGDVQVEQGLGWLDPRFSVKENPSGSSWIHYWLYSVERVGRLLDTEFLGAHEWYPLGARRLVDTQRPDGLWQTSGETEALATPFALLFLTRATPKLKAEAPTGPGELLTSALQPPGRKLYIILDASGSMLEEVAGKTKFDIARDAVAELIQRLPDSTQVALRVYGHRKRAIEDGADEDGELLLPMGRLDRARFSKLLAGLRARGKTPLAYSLEQSLGQITGGTAQEPLTLLLLTDGGEDTKARRDPVTVAQKLPKIAHLRFRIVGFDIEREAWNKQLLAMAAAGDGLYLPALRTQSLLETLQLAAFDVPSGWLLFDASLSQVGSGKFGDALTLPPGDYTLRTQRGEQNLEVKVVIRPAGRTRVTFDPLAK